MSWKCPDACARISKEDNSNTPVRSARAHHDGDEFTSSPTVDSGLDRSIIEYFDQKFTNMQENCKKDFVELLNPLRSELKAVSDRILSWEDRLSALEAKICHQEEISFQLQKENSELREQMRDSHKKLNDIDQASRNCNIEIQNIPYLRNENLIQIVQNIGNLINVEIPVNSIRAVHRVAAARTAAGAVPQPDRPKNIVLQLTTRRLRDEILHAARVRRNLATDQIGIDVSPPRRLYVNEHLNLTNKILYNRARQAVKDKSYKYVWVKNLCIFVRKTDTSKIIQIRDDSDLCKIL